MLVLTRKAGEEIIVAGNIRIQILEVRGDRIRIGVTAPGSIRVDRGEVHDQRHSSGRFAAARPAQLETIFATAH